MGGHRPALDTERMRTFAATGTCLDCALTLHGAHHCPRCGLLQVGPVASRLHEMLAEADALMRSLDSQRAPINVRPAVTPDKAPTPEPARPVLPPLPEDRPRHEPVSVGSVLLGLGALCLVVAAVVFVVVTWGSMSLSTRTLLLIGATAVAFVAAARLTVRRLHGSVEAVSAVAWLFLIVDVAAARVAGLLGLDALDLTDLATLTGLLMALAASMAAVATHRLVGREPYVTSTVAAVGWWLVGASAAWQWEQSAAWTLVVLVLAAAALSVGYRAVGSLVTGALLAGSTLALHGLLWAEALRTALSADVTALLAGGQLWPVLVAMGLTVAAAEAIRRRHPGERADAVVHGAGLLTTLLGVVVLVVPAWQSAPTHGVTALCLVTVALAATGLLGLRPWTRGPRALAAVSAAGCLLVASPWAAWLCLELAVLVAAPWCHPMDASLDGLRLDTPADLSLIHI